jgi:E3 ubiquitin-protein ligase RNF216
MFCLECCRRNAESQIGLSRWELQCISTEVCAAGFSHAERLKFLDPKLMQALDRLEGDSVINLAGLDITACPFCPFAAEYPPIEEDREFQCKNEACMKISCRLCRKETHVPKTCEEALQDTGSAARLMIEEAMSKAMIRLCNKCQSMYVPRLEMNLLMR